MSRRLIFICGLWLLIGCEPEVILIDTTSVPKKLVVNCLIRPDSLAKISVTSTSDTLIRRFNATFIKNAEIALRTNGIDYSFNQIIDYDSNYNELREIYYLSNERISVNPGDLLELEVSAKGFETVRAKNILPTHVHIDEVTIDPIPVYITPTYTEGAGTKEQDDVRAGNYYVLNIKFNDPPGESNYYRIVPWIFEKESHYYSYYEKIAKNDSVLKKGVATRVQSYPLSLSFYTRDPSVEAIDKWFGKGPLYNDRIFDGSEYSFELLMTEETMKQIQRGNAIHVNSRGDTSKYESRLIISLHSLDEHIYKYMATSSYQFYTQGGVFVEPIIVHTNIENGFGIFGSEILSTNTLDLTSLQ